MEPQIEILDRETHRNLHVRDEAIPPRNFLRVIPAEIGAAAAVCPVLLAKDAQTGRFYVGALSGFSEGENLLADSAGAGGAFRPLALQLDGFAVAGENIAIDRASPRFSETGGLPLFDQDGEPAPAMRQIQRLLGQYKAGTDAGEALIEALLRHALIEPIDVSLRFDDGKTIDLVGVYTVSLDRLQALDDAAVIALFRSGHLQLAFAIAGSLRQIPVLADRRNRRLAAAG